MRKKYHIEGIDCANCAAKVEKKMNELPDVAVTLTFATSQLLVEAKNPDEVQVSQIQIVLMSLLNLRRKKLWICRRRYLTEKHL